MHLCKSGAACFDAQTGLSFRCSPPMILESAQVAGCVVREFQSGVAQPVMAALAVRMLSAIFQSRQEPHQRQVVDICGQDIGSATPRPGTEPREPGAPPCELKLTVSAAAQRAVEPQGIALFALELPCSKQDVHSHPSIPCLSRQAPSQGLEVCCTLGGTRVAQGMAEHGNTGRDSADSKAGSCFSREMPCVPLKISVECRLCCIRELGVGPGGFYTPSYTGGGQLRLKMMCLGKHWEPRTAQYEDTRSEIASSSKFQHIS